MTGNGSDDNGWWWQWNNCINLMSGAVRVKTHLQKKISPNFDFRIYLWWCFFFAKKPYMAMITWQCNWFLWWQWRALTLLPPHSPCSHHVRKPLPMAEEKSGTAKKSSESSAAETAAGEPHRCPHAAIIRSFHCMLMCIMHTTHAYYVAQIALADVEAFTPISTATEVTPPPSSATRTTTKTSYTPSKQDKVEKVFGACVERIRALSSCRCIFARKKTRGQQLLPFRAQSLQRVQGLHQRQVGSDGQLAHP